MRKKLLTDSVLAQIPQWIRDERLAATKIAEKIGCTVGTLRVRCSQHGISLRQPSPLRRPPTGATPDREVMLSLPDETRLRLQQRAASVGLSDAELVSVLIETIDRDDLYSAVLDDRDRRDEET